MGFYTYYQAIPERCGFLNRLKTKRDLCSLFTRLLYFGSGPFHLAKLDSHQGDLDEYDVLFLEDLDGFLDEIARYEVFGTREAVNRCLAALKAELSFAMATYPGMEERFVTIEKQHERIERALVEELKLRGSEGDLRLMNELLYGDAPLIPGLFDRFEPQLFYVAPSTVAEGVRMLAAVEVPDDQYQNWKRFLGMVAALDEAVLILPTTG